MVPVIALLGLAFASGWMARSEMPREDALATWAPLPWAKPLPEMLESKDE